MKRKLLFHLICILLCFSIVFNNSCLIYANSTGGISNPDDYQRYPNGMRKYSFNEALSAGLAETAKTVVFLASGLFAVAQGDGNAAMENLVNWIQVAGWGDEKMFVVDDNGNMSTLPVFKQMVTEYKNYYIQQNPSSAMTQPIILKSQTFENYFNKHYEVWSSDPVHKFCHSLNLFDMFGSKLDSNDFVYSSHRDADNECIHLLDNYSNLSKYEYHFFYGGFTSDVEIGKCVATWGLGGAVYNAQTGKTVDHSEGRYSYCLTGSETVTEGDYDGYSYWCVRLSDTVYDCPTMATSDGRPFFFFSNYADGVQYYDSLFSSLNKAGLTINNYNKIYKYLSDPKEPGSIVVTPNNVVDYEPKDYTIDTPTDPGDSGGGSDSGGGASPEDSSGIINAINNLYDMLEQKLNKIISQIRTNNILTGLDLLNDIFNDYIKDFATATTELGETVKSKFPFCLPFVIVGALALTNKSATAPKFTIPFKYDTIGVNYDIVIDFSDAKWNACRNVIYYFTLFFYMFGLIYLTFKASKVKE